MSVEITSSYLRKLLDGHMEVIADSARETLKDVEFDAIAFRGMSGALSAAVVGLALNKPLILVRKTTEGCHAAGLLEGALSARRYIIVDDFICSGRTCKEIQDAVQAHNAEAICVGLYATVDPEVCEENISRINWSGQNLNDRRGQ